MFYLDKFHSSLNNNKTMFSISTLPPNVIFETVNGWWKWGVALITRGSYDTHCSDTLYITEDVYFYDFL